MVIALGAAALGGAFDAVPSSGDAPSNVRLPGAATALSGTISLGEEQVIGADTSEPGRDTTLTRRNDGPVPGIAVLVPGEAYVTSNTFALSARDITLSGYDNKLIPLSKAITIENGGGYAAAPISITVPVTIPAGSFAMGFYLTANNGLEPMPLLDESATSITVASRHFSSFVILALAEAALPTEIGTGFRADEDDLQTPNYGSFLEDGGHCAGQSLTEMWYFTERKAAGAPALWGLTDNNGLGTTPDLWQDDAQAYRLASMVQYDLNWKTLSANLERLMGKAHADSLQWDAFRMAMLVTGQPQFVGLNETGQDGGHAIVAYAATATGLWVADPNFPGKLRDIEWNAASQSFSPYNSGTDATSSDHHYDRISFFGKTAFVNWGQIGARWNDLAAGVIGDDRFPLVQAQIEVTAADGTASYQPLADGPIANAAPWLTVEGLSSPVPTLRASFYLGTTRLGTANPGKLAQIKLPAGNNDLGVYIEGQNAEGKWHAITFVHFHLVVPGEVASPTPKVTAKPTAKPTPKATKKPTPTPAGFDCSGPPPGVVPGTIAYVQWSLHCNAISP